MKKILSLILLVLLPVVANANHDFTECTYDAYIDGVYYNFNGNEAEVTFEGYYVDYGYEGEDMREIIPSYSGSVVIPKSVTNNGKTYSVTSIGAGAFSGCRGLTSVTIPNSVTSIGVGAFSGCHGLTSVTIPNSVTSIGNYAFYDCRGLTSITIPNSVTSIGKEAFYSCRGLTSITIPNSVTSIGESAFYDCSGLTSIKVEAGNTIYDSRNNCNAIIETATNTLIAGCQNTVIPNGVTSLGEGAFGGCSSLTSINIPNSVTRIGSSAFSGCRGLTSITIGNSVTSIGNNAFAGCSGLTSVTIPNSVTSIGDAAFGRCSSLTSVNIPDGVTSIGSWTFSGCSSLTSVIIPNSVTSIGVSAFSGCSSLTSVNIGNSVTSIKDGAFYNCSGLTDVYCYAEKVPFASYSNVFNDSAISSATLHVPAESVELYKATSPWNKFGTIVPIDGDMPEPKKCATPTISYTNGELTFSCETEGAICQSTITDTDISSYSTNKVQLSVTYIITVYATKADYENSEVATAILCWIDQKPDMEGITDDNATQVTMMALPVLVQTQGGNITIQGAAEGTPISIYDTSGKQYGSTISEKDHTTISTSLQPGSVAIVKIGEKAVKVVIK